jgi:hypothetical protein
VGFVDRELSRIESALREPQTADRYGQLYAAQQALKWATEPQGFATPLDVILRGLVQPVTDTLGEPAGCSAALHPLPS